MTQDPENVKSGIRQLGYEFQALQEEANRLLLPDNIPALIESWMSEASKLSEELPQKTLIIKYLKWALNEYRLNDMQQVRLRILLVIENFENAAHDQWVNGVQKQYGHNAERQRQIIKEVIYPKHDLWKKMADDIRNESKRKKSKLELAKEIKEKLDKENPNKTGAVGTIRKIIK